MAASDGRCKFGDARADGFVRSDGVAVVVLKPLADALRDGDHVRAVVLGSAVNNDGRGSGYLLTPAVEGQESVLRSAYGDARVDPADVDYVEAHGTGTPVGDRVELEALSRVLGPGRCRDRPCIVGSAKSVVGHTESAAGLVGVIRTVLCLENALVPPNPRLGEPNAGVDWLGSGLRLTRAAAPLDDRGRPTVAGVSSFGLSGTNAHVVLASAPAVTVRDRPETSGRSALLVLSARSPRALDQLTAAYRSHLAPGGAGRNHDLPDIARAAADRRDHHEFRLSVVADSHDGALTRLAESSTARALARATRTAERRPRIAFVFSGQGSRWVGMGRGLLADEPVFARALMRCDEAVRAETGWSVLQNLATADTGRLADIDVVQPMIWALQVALAELWRSWGVEPDVVIGHSMGEVAAGCVAGALTVQDAAAIICRRSRVTGRLRGQGAMVLVELSENAAAGTVREQGAAVVVAAANGPTETVLAGDPAELGRLVDRLGADGVFTRWVDVDVASHSPQMDALGAELAEALADVEPRPGTVPIRSTVLGEVIDGSGMDAAYWVANLRRSVRFLSAVRAETVVGDTVFVEVSPHPLLTAAVSDTVERDGSRSSAVGSLRRGRPERASMLASLGELYAAGHPVTGTAVAGPGRGRRVDLPTYPWQHEIHWLAGVRPPAARDRSGPDHPLLGREQHAADGRTRQWLGQLDRTAHRYLDDHRVDGSVIVAGTVYLEMLTAAGVTVLGGPVVVADVRFERSLFLLTAAAPQLRTTATSSGPDAVRLTVASRPADGEDWTTHVEAVARTAPVGSTADRASDITPPAGRPGTGGEFYAAVAERGNTWGPAFQGVTRLWTADGEAVARLRRPEAIDGERPGGLFHPAWLDACLQPLLAATPADVGHQRMFVLGAVDEIQVHRAPESRLWSRARLRHDADPVPDSVVGDVLVTDDEGRAVVEVRGLRLRYLTADPPASDVSTLEETELLTLRWSGRVDVRPVGAATGAWVVFSAGDPVGESVVAALRAAGGRVTVVRPGPWSGGLVPSEHQVRPGDGAGLRQALLAAADGGPLRGVAHLWSLAIPDGVAAGWSERTRDLGCGSVTELVGRLGRELGDPRLWLVTRGAQAVDEADLVTAPLQAPLWGLGRTVAREESQLGPVLVDVDHAAGVPAALVTEMLAMPGDARPVEDQIALRRGRRLVARLSPSPTGAPGRDATASVGPDSAAVLAMTVAGDLDDVTLTPGPVPRPGPGQVLIRTVYAAVQFQDVLLASGAYPGPDAGRVAFGKDCAGVVEAVGVGVETVAVGDEVMALAAMTMATHVVTDARLVVRRPAGLTMAEAATLPSAFVTALHGLVELGRIDSGDTVLVHCAAGGVGLAAVQVARSRGARVIGTAGTPEKRALLPMLGVHHVADSRSERFVDEVRALTGDGGCDVILNSLAGSAIPANLRLLAPYGRYVELGKRDFHDDVPLGMGNLKGNISFSSVDVVAMINDEPARVGVLLRRIVELVEQGTLRPLPHRVHSHDDAAAAFRTIARGDNVGRMLIDFSVPREGRAGVAEGEVRADATYLVTGGLGGLGVHVARRLVDRGARHLLLVGRTPLPDRADWDALPAGSPHACAVAGIRRLEDGGEATVQYAAVDVADRGAMSALLGGRACAGHPAVHGVFHLAGILERRAVRDVRSVDLDAGLRAKIEGTAVLDGLPELAGLDVFVLFSSASALLSSPLLGVYAAGNAFLDAFARFRRAGGRPVTVVDWGFWDVPGMGSTGDAEGAQRPVGTGGLTVARALAHLEHILASGSGSAVVMPVDWARWAAAHPAAATAPLLAELVPDSPPEAVVEHPSAPEPPAPPRELVARPTPHAPSGTDDVDRLVSTHTAAVMGLDRARLEIDRPLSRIGVDSLMAAELRTKIYRTTGVRLSIGLLLGGATVADLVAAVRSELAGTVVPEVVTVAAGRA
jgi:acyl transferase domain-containing protein/acyl carrier protein